MTLYIGEREITPTIITQGGRATPEAKIVTCEANLDYLASLSVENDTFFKCYIELTLTNDDPFINGGVFADNKIIFGCEENGKIIVSHDGEKFEYISTGLDNYLEYINYNNGIWCGVGDDGYFYSTNNVYSENWTKTSLTTPLLRPIFVVNNKFITSSETESATGILYSLNGIDWESGLIFEGVGFLKSIAYGNGIYVGNFDKKIMYSTDLINWSDSELPSAGFVCYTNNMFMAFQFNSQNIYISSNGIDWNLSPNRLLQNYYGDDFSGCVFENSIYIPDNYGIHYSKNNGVTWNFTQIPDGSPGNLVYCNWD